MMWEVSRGVRSTDLAPVAGPLQRRRWPFDGAAPDTRKGGNATVTGTTLDDYTDRYAQRVRGMTTSEIRALFAVTSGPEVVSLAGGAPFVAALPLDAVGETLVTLGGDNGA